MFLGGGPLRGLVATLLGVGPLGMGLLGTLFGWGGTLVGWSGWLASLLGWQGGIATLVAARGATIGLGWGGGASWFETSMYMQALLVLTKVGVLGIGLVAALLVAGVSFYRRRVPNLVTLIIVVLALVWLCTLYTAPFEKVRRSVAQRRERLERDWNKDCKGKTHASLEFSKNCATWEAELDEDETWAVFSRVNDMVYERAWGVVSALFVAGMALVLCFGIAQKWLIHVDKTSYMQQRLPDATTQPGQQTQ